MSLTRHRLEPGKTLTATAREGRAHVYSEQLGTGRLTRGSITVGPYLVATDWRVDGDATVAIADYLTPVGALLLANAGAPVDAAQAAATVNPAGDDNALTFTARAYGAEGNAISVAYTDPGANDAALSVSVFRQAITVSLATGEAGAITSTAAEVKAAIEAHVAANDLVTVAIDASDSGSADDGSGVVTAMAATALEGGAGTGIGILQPGGLLIDTTNADVYRNSGTLAAPAFTQLGDAA